MQGARLSCIAVFKVRVLRGSAQKPTIGEGLLSTTPKTRRVSLMSQKSHGHFLFGPAALVSASPAVMQAWGCTLAVTSEVIIPGLCIQSKAPGTLRRCRGIDLLLFGKRSKLHILSTLALEERGNEAVPYR